MEEGLIKEMGSLNMTASEKRNPVKFSYQSVWNAWSRHMKSDLYYINLVRGSETDIELEVEMIEIEIEIDT